MKLKTLLNCEAEVFNQSPVETSTLQLKNQEKDYFECNVEPTTLNKSFCLHIFESECPSGTDYHPPSENTMFQNEVGKNNFFISAHVHVFVQMFLLLHGIKNKVKPPIKQSIVIFQFIEYYWWCFNSLDFMGQYLLILKFSEKLPSR